MKNVVGILGGVVAICSVLVLVGWSPEGRYSSLSEASAAVTATSANAEQVAATVLAHQNRHDQIKISSLILTKGVQQGDAANSGITTSLVKWVARSDNIGLVKDTVSLLIKGGSGGAEGSKERLRAIELACESQGFDASLGVAEPAAESDGGVEEKELRALMADQETCWKGVESFCKEHLGSDPDQMKTCIISVCVVHASIA